ncbi:MAG: hypothetical protein Q9M20_02670 [Mariprofundaceae bacterium]|nr:hypothetical protein [Mariprofundaceae bacterium]
MSESRDIDEILASLDALLREGNNYNDVAPAKPEVIENKNIAVKTVKAKSVEPKILEPSPPSQKPISATKAHKNMVKKSNKHDKKSKHPTTNPALADTKTGREDQVHVEQAHAGRAARLLLTKEMLVEGTQKQPLERKLPENTNKAAKPMQAITASEPVVHLQKKDIEHLLALVSRDISNHLQKNLPKLIHQSLHAHLSVMQPSTKKTKKRHQ